MQPLTREDLFSLEQYAESRASFRARVLEHKRNRRVPLGPHATLYFEDRLTVQYQIQEMLRTERIFERKAIEEELEAYNPLIPSGANLKATFMLEYPDVAERQAALARLRGIEDVVWMQVGTDRVMAVADEDLDRANDEKTSAVHFLRFELSEGMRRSLAAGATMRFGIDHASYQHDSGALSEAVRAALAADLDAVAA